MPCSILFVGDFRHAPNADAVLFFYRHVLPLVRRSLRDVAVTIVGDAPPREVRALSSADITVTGWVPDVEPYLTTHCISIAPLRFGAGLKGKIVEAMATGLPVVTTPVGAEGMELVHGSTALIAESPEAFARAVIQLSDRYKHEDNFWFAFFHEAAHILLHSKRETFIDDGSEDTELETQANRLAANTLIPPSAARELPLLATDADVERFAATVGISPGIVVGRLHNDRIWDWHEGNHLRRHLHIVDA